MPSDQLGSSSDSDASQNDGQHANQSVITGISLIKTVAGLDGPKGLKEIAMAAGMLPSRTHRYLSSLVQTGLIEQDEYSGRYSLGAGLIELGLVALGRIDAVKIAIDALRQLSASTGLISILSVWGSNGPTVIKAEQGRLDPMRRATEGRNLPVLTSATGRTYLAYLPLEETRKILEQEFFAVNAALSDSPRLTMEDVERLRADVLDHGMAENARGTGHETLAAPAFDHDGKLTMVLTLFANTGTVDMGRDSDAARQLKQAADGVSRRLGAFTNPDEGPGANTAAAKEPEPQSL